MTEPTTDFNYVRCISQKIRKVLADYVRGEYNELQILTRRKLWLTEYRIRNGGSFLARR